MLTAFLPSGFAQLNPDGSWHVPTRNNVWFHEAGSDTVFVFVHGLASDSGTSWTYLQNGQPRQYWPYLVWVDERLNHPSVFLGGYRSWGPNYGLIDTAAELMDGLRRENVLRYPKIIFLTHSLGGIVVRYMLYNRREEFRDKKIGILLFASPSAGSYWAKIAGILGIQGELVKRLQPQDPVLRDLDLHFKGLVSGDDFRKEDRLSIMGAEAIEEQFIMSDGAVSPLSPMRIVDGDSGARYFGTIRMMPGTNHSSIVKPPDLENLSHLFVVDFYKRFAQQFQTAPVLVPDPGPRLPGVEPSTLTTWRVLRCSDAPVLRNGQVVFNDLPPSQLVFEWDQAAWQLLIHKQGNGNQQLVLVSRKPGVQTSCEVKWRIAN